MNIPSWQIGSTAPSAAQTVRNRGSRRRTVIMAAGVLLLLYAGLLFALRGNAQAASPAIPVAPQAAATPTPQPEIDQPSQGEGAVSPTLLAEFDRLSDSEGEAASETLATDEQNPSNLVSTLLFSMLLIVSLIYGGVWLYKRYVKPTGANGLAAGGRLLAVQESHAIGPNQKLHLVRLGNELLLIGATEHNITFLARYDGETASDSFAAHLQNAAATENGQSGTALDLNDGLQRLRGLNRSTQRGGSDE